MSKQIHHEDFDQIASEHSAYCDRVEDAAMALQDLSYRLGFERGRKEANKELLEALQAFMALSQSFTTAPLHHVQELAEEGSGMARAVLKARAAIARATGSEA